MNAAARAVTSRSERGWAFVVVLIALAIAAILARDALSRYFGLFRDGAATTSSRLPPAAVVPETPSSTPTHATPIERARGVEDTIAREAAERGRRVDGQAR